MTTVIRVGNLEEFTAEIPVPRALPGSPIEPRPPVVRLSLTERLITRAGAHLPINEVSLHLQALNDQGQVIWLMEEHRLGWTYDGPFSRVEDSIYAGMKALRDIVTDHLRAQGYDVRVGSFALPRNVQPVNGHFECAVWRKNDDSTFVVVAPGEKTE